MTTNVITVAEDATAQEAAALMLRHRVSALPVIDRSGRLVRIVSEGDLMRLAELGSPVLRPRAKQFSKIIALAAIQSEPRERAHFTKRLHVAKLKSPIEQLSQGLAEGMGSRHREMPQIQFSTDEVAAILNYLGSVTGIAPARAGRYSTDDADRTDPTLATS